MRKHDLALNCFLLAFGWEVAEVCLPTEMDRGVQCLIPNPGLLPPLSGACSHLVETFRRNVSTIDGQKGGYISGFGMRSKLYYKRPI